MPSIGGIKVEEPVAIINLSARTVSWLLKSSENNVKLYTLLDESVIF